MAILLRFKPEGMTSAKYSEVVRKLEAAGEGSPAGRIFHVAFGDQDNLYVSDIWDSRESFERFGQTLVPILGELGIAAGEPEEIAVFNTIAGAQTRTTAG
jgi:hypothetical protein